MEKTSWSLQIISRTLPPQYIPDSAKPEPPPPKCAVPVSPQPVQNKAVYNSKVISKRATKTQNEQKDKQQTDTQANNPTSVTQLIAEENILPVTAAFRNHASKDTKVNQVILITKATTLTTEIGGGGGE